MIGDSVTGTVLEVKGNQVRLGIDAPLDLPVFREEIYERIKERAERPRSGPGFSQIKDSILPLA